MSTPEEQWPGVPLRQFMAQEAVRSQAPAAPPQDPAEPAAPQWPGVPVEQFSAPSQTPARSVIPTNTELRNQPPVAGGVARAPGIGTTAAANLATDPEQRRRIYAAQLFPGMPLREALSRIEVGPNGRLYVTQPNGSAMPIEPDRPNMQDPGSFRPDRFAHWAASGAGEALPMLGGMAGGFLAAPTNIPGGMAGAAAGAAVGDAARQGLAGYFDPGSQPYNYGQTAAEAGLAALGQGGAAAINLARAPNIMRLPERDLSRLATDPAVLAEARRRIANAAAQGVDLTTGQATRLPSQLSLEDAARINAMTADDVLAFYQRQGRQIGGAADQMLAGISPVDNITTASQNFRVAAGGAANAPRLDSNRAARPFYQQAESLGARTSPDLEILSERPSMREALAAGRRLAADDGVQLGAANDFQVWNYARQALDDMIGEAQTAGNHGRVRSLRNIQQSLTQHLEAVYPTYGQARAAAAPGQALTAALEETAAGRVAGSGIDSRARQILAPIFESANPQYVAQVRDAFIRSGQTDQWNAGIRAYLQDAIARASTSQAGLNPTMLRRQIWANVEDGVRVNMQAAMTPQQFAGFNNFMRMIEDVSRTYPVNSLTVERLGGQEALRQAGEDAGTRFWRGLGTTLSTNSVNALQGFFHGFAERRNARNIQEVVGNLFSDEGVRYLEQMARVSPSSRRAMVLTGQFLARPIASEATGPATPAR